MEIGASRGSLPPPPSNEIMAKKTVQTSRKNKTLYSFNAQS